MEPSARPSSAASAALHHTSTHHPQQMATPPCTREWGRALTWLTEVPLLCHLSSPHWSVLMLTLPSSGDSFSQDRRA